MPGRVCLLPRSGVKLRPFLQPLPLCARFGAVNAKQLVGMVLISACTGCPQSGTPAVPPSQVATVGKAVEAAPSAPPQADPDGPCTLDTKLIPGIAGSPGHPIPSTINPNGNSELAQLMRTMQADLKRAREAIEKGEKVGPLWPRFRKIRCSWPTNQADRNAAFDTAAQSYLAAVQALESAPVSEARAAYGRVLDGCRACHEQSCSGAIPAIEALRMTTEAK